LRLVNSYRRGGIQRQHQRRRHKHQRWRVGTTTSSTGLGSVERVALGWSEERAVWVEHVMGESEE
jgi:hypothetical protein